MTWPLAAHLGSRIPTGTGSDTWVHVWTFWWLARALTTGADPLFTPMLFHPSGASLTSHNIAWVNFALWFPLQAALGDHRAYSLTYLLLYSLNAYAMYLFAYDTVRDRRAAWLAGVVYGFWPYALAQSDHPNMLPLAWLPLALLYLRRALAHGALRYILAAGGFLALLGIARWQLLFMASPIIGLFILAQVIAGGVWRRARTWTALLGASMVMVVFMAPLALPVVYAQLTRPFADELLVHEPEFAADLVAYVVPHQRSLLWSPLVAYLPPARQFTEQEIHFIGYTNLVLALVGLATYRRQGLVWAAAALVLVVLSLGPTLTVWGREVTAVPAPYVLVQDWFWARIVRMPHRYSLLVGFPVAMLAAYGARYLLRRAGSRATLSAALLSLLVLLESSPGPYPLAATTIPPWYLALAAEPEPFAILTLPISPRLTDKFAMYYQTRHGKPLVGGHISRQPRETIVYMVGSPWLYEMLFRRTMDPAQGDVSRQLRYLAQANVRYVIMDKAGATADQVRDWSDWLTIRPRYEDDYLVVFATEPQPGLDFDVADFFTADIGLIRADYTPHRATQGDLLRIEARWAALAAPGRDLEICAFVVLPAPPATSEEPLGPCMSLHADWPASDWQANEIVRAEYLLALDPRLPPAGYQLALRLRDPASAEFVGQPVALGRLEVVPLARRFDAPAPTYAAVLRFDDVVALHGYDIRWSAPPEGDLAHAATLRLTLYWQALRRMELSYKVFVHVVEDASGALVAQRDALPRNWSYPTTWWEPGEYVEESIDLPIPITATQPLRVLVGLYDEATGERLPLRDDAGSDYPDRAFPLILPAPP